MLFNGRAEAVTPQVPAGSQTPQEWTSKLCLDVEDVSGTQLTTEAPLSPRVPLTSQLAPLLQAGS